MLESRLQIADALLDVRILRIRLRGRAKLFQRTHPVTGLGEQIGQRDSSGDVIRLSARTPRYSAIAPALSPPAANVSARLNRDGR